MVSGLRERKKRRTREQIAAAALARFTRDGFDRTSVQQICDDAEVALSTFYAYFPSKEATAFPDDDERADLVAATIRDAPDELPPSAVLRRASLALARQDSDERPSVELRMALSSDEPALAAYAARRQAEHGDRFTALLATRMGVDPVRDMRPRLLVSTAMAAVTAAWSAWLAVPASDLLALVNQAHDLLEQGLGTTERQAAGAPRRPRRK